VLNKAPRHENVRGCGGTAPRILDPGTEKEVSGQLHDPAALSPEKEPPVPIG
jgi:hypothetical protein